jgi:hypothetical protein
MRSVLRDPRTLIGRKSQEDPRYSRVIRFLEKGSEEMQESLRAGVPYAGATNADGLFYADTRQPFMIADQTQITGTAEALLWPAQYTSLVANYFTVGKMVYINSAGKMSTAGSSQGNLTLNLRYGTTTGGTSVAASAATALAATKSNITWQLEAWVCCQVAGSGTAGKLVGWGRFMFDGAGGLFTTAAQNPLYFPATTPGTQAGVDTTSAQGIVLGATMGSASDLMTTSYLQFMALN